MLTGPGRYHNETGPPTPMPRHNQGAIAVIVRVVDDEHGEHYRPAEARRWTETHVMVAFRGASPTGRDSLAWLPASDVYRTLPGKRTAPPSE